jgi:hypothetical protein
LHQFGEEYTVKKQILVTNDQEPRIMGNVHILPWKIFLEKLWGGEIMK